MRDGVKRLLRVSAQWAQRLGCRGTAFTRFEHKGCALCFSMPFSGPTRAPYLTDHRNVCLLAPGKHGDPSKENRTGAILGG